MLPKTTYTINLFMLIMVNHTIFFLTNILSEKMNKGNLKKNSSCYVTHEENLKKKLKLLSSS